MPPFPVRKEHIFRRIYDESVPIQPSLRAHEVPPPELGGQQAAQGIAQQMSGAGAVPRRNSHGQSQQSRNSCQKDRQALQRPGPARILSGPAAQSRPRPQQNAGMKNLEQGIESRSRQGESAHAGPYGRGKDFR